MAQVAIGCDERKLRALRRLTGLDFNDAVTVGLDLLLKVTNICNDGGTVIAHSHGRTYQIRVPIRSEVDACIDQLEAMLQKEDEP